MRKLLIVFFLVTTFVSGAFAGGVMTNLNQSAAYIRMMGRDASTGLDAAFVIWNLSRLSFVGLIVLIEFTLIIEFFYQPINSIIFVSVFSLLSSVCPP